MPFLIFGKNSVITNYDFLDHVLPYYKMFHDNALFFQFNVPTKGFNEISTLHYSLINFNLSTLLYAFLDDFTALITNHFLTILIGSFSMFLLLHRYFKFSFYLSMFVSVCYAILPVVPNFGIPIATIPFIIYIFLCLYKKYQGFSYKSLLLLFYPFFSRFAEIGIFILFLWMTGIFISSIKYHKININLLTSFLMLCIGYILVDIRLFYVLFILGIPLNRILFSSADNTVFTMINILFSSWKEYLVSGYYHVASVQKKIIFPLTVLITSFYLFINYTDIKASRKNTKIQFFNLLRNISGKFGVLLLCEASIIIFTFIAGLYRSGLFEKLIEKFLPILSGFQWNRFYIFSRVLWYIIFALCLETFLNIRSSSLTFLVYGKRYDVPARFWTSLVLIISCLQLFNIMTVKADYNNARATWAYGRHLLFAKFNSKKHAEILKNDDYLITYNDFFSPGLFNAIKKDISYNNEKVAAFGYHPSILMYNGFNCIDGINNAYPLSYYNKFRTLIEPELEVNKKARDFFSSQGNIFLYLFSTEIDYRPTKNKDRQPANLNIDINVFINDFNGKYILSCTEILNADDLGIRFVKQYNDSNSIYRIYLYMT
jgi:hypothetical protein